MSKLLTDRQRRTLLAIGQTIIPQGQRLARFDAAALERFERLFVEMEPAMQRAVRAVILAIDTESRVRHVRGFTGLSSAKQNHLLTLWQSGIYARRMAFRLLSVLLKSAYFSMPERFAAFGIPFGKPPVVDEPARWWSQVIHGRDLSGDLELDAEVVVVGTGAGGAVVAAELAEAGNAVVLLEQGEFYRRADFSGHALQMQKLMYRDAGLTFTLGNVPILLPYGICVGGTTAVNSGTCFRTPTRTLSRWRSEFGLSEFTDDYMAPYFARVESVYQVTPADMKYVGANGRIIARGAEKLGFAHGPLPRNAPDCDGQGVCAYGCPTGAKRSTDVSFIPRALKAGASLITGAQVDEILKVGGQAAGLRARTKTGQTVRVNAPIVVLAGGAFGTPLLLMKNKLGNVSGQLGKNLSIHPSAGIVAIVDEVVNAHESIPQGYMVDEFAEEDLLLEGVALPLDVTALMFPNFGADYVRIMERFRHISMFGFMTEDSSRGMVRPGPDGKPMVLYRLNATDKARLLRGFDVLNRVYLAAGAQEIHSPVNGWTPVRTQADLERNLRKSIRAWDLDISAYHPLGTCHMGASPARSVTSPQGELWDLPGCFIADGSVVPPGLGVNPMITISALAVRCADYIAARLNR